LRQGRSAGSDNELAELAKAYNRLGNNANKSWNNRTLGSLDHLNDVAKVVFGDRFVSRGFRHGEKYDRIMKNQVVMMSERIRADIKSDLGSGAKQITESHRKYLRDAVNELVEFGASRVDQGLEVMLMGYRAVGSSIAEATMANLDSVAEALFKSISFELEAGLGYGKTIRAGTTIEIEGTAAKYTLTLDHNGVRSSTSSGFDASAGMLGQLGFGGGVERDWSGEFTHTVGISQRERTIGRVGNDIELSVGFSTYKGVGGGARIVFNVSEYNRQRGR